MKFINRIVILIAASAVLTIVNAFGCRDVMAAQTSLVEFDYDASGKNTGDKLTEYGDKDGYVSTSGQGNLICCMATDSPRALEWSDPEYDNGGVNIVPIVRASSKNMWGDTPSFTISVSTYGYTYIKFSAKMAGSSNGPGTWKLQFSMDGVNYSDISGSDITIDYDARKTMKYVYNEFSMPDAVSNRDIVYIRIISSSVTTIVGGNYLSLPWGGETAINNICVSGTDLASVRTETTASTTQPAATSENTTQKQNETGRTKQTETQTTDKSSKKNTAGQSNNTSGTTIASNSSNSESSTKQNNNAAEGISNEEEKQISGEVQTHIVTETNAAGETVTSIVYDETEAEKTTEAGTEDATEKSAGNDSKKSKKKSRDILTSGETDKSSSKKTGNMIIIAGLVVVLAAGIAAVALLQKRNKG